MARPRRTTSRAGRGRARAGRKTAGARQKAAKVVRKPVKALRKTAKASAQPTKTRRKTERPRTLARPPLDRVRRVLADEERLERAASETRAALQDDHLTSAAHAGHDAARAERLLHTESSPALTAGDVDAKWQDAYAIGDEAPGGDNPTPDQDRVDDIGRALGIEYADGQELRGGDEVLERDRHRWELDPASSDEEK